MYTVRTVALALPAPTKWVDNLLSHHPIPGIDRRARGSERSIGPAAAIAIAVIHVLAEDLGLPIRRAVELATTLEDPFPSTLRLVRPSGLVIEIPVEDIARRLRQRLIDAAEAVVHIRRGRPPKRTHPE